MDRREFLKDSLFLSACGALAPLANAEDKLISPLTSDALEDKPVSPLAPNAKVMHRQYRNTDITVSLLGYGLMRLPRIDPNKPDIDYPAAEKLIERAFKAGINYFDTAYVYHNGLSEKFVGDVLSKYPRDSYYLATKMPVHILKKQEQVDQIFNEQLKRCKTEYFDFYLLHTLTRDRWEVVKNLKVYEYLKQKQEEGKIRHLGFSFHDEPEVLEVIASAHPWDFAQIQLNYLDWELYRSREQYEILAKKNIPAVIMEPLRGGSLSSLNPSATKVLKTAEPNASTASWAFRFAGSLPNVLTVLSGMTYSEHLEDNIKTFSNFHTLTEAEHKTLDKALVEYLKSGVIPCTGCQYCVPCPKGIPIPRLFGLYNHSKNTGSWAHLYMVYLGLPEKQKVSACVNCRLCVQKCPQHIDIPAQLKTVEEALKQIKF
jgi:predicted aldo/keto reductase-like oxidoreductase